MFMFSPTTTKKISIFWIPPPIRCTVPSVYRVFGVPCFRGLSYYNYVIYTHVGKYSDNIHIEK